MQKIPKNSKILKNDGHFRIPHPQISIKQVSNICENLIMKKVRGRKSRDTLPLTYKILLSFCTLDLGGLT